MSVQHPRRRALAIAAITLAFALGAVGTAEARRGGSFGSRGMRTYSAPRSTYVAPEPVAPIRRSMTTPGAAPAYAPASRPAAAPYGQTPQPQRGGFLGRWGGPILGGIAAAGLVGMLMGHGFGGAAGLGSLVLQLGIAALAVMLVMRLFRRREAPAAYAGPMGAPMDGPGPSPYPQSGYPPPYDPRSQPAAPYPASYEPQPPPSYVPGGREGDEIGLVQQDYDAFEQLLQEVQAAFGGEDYAALRERTTPEVMSYMAEELSQNAVAGRRNEVRDVRLLAGDLSEAWSEDGRDYATVAMRYSSVELMRDRTTGQIVEGAEAPSETIEVWTFVREPAAVGVGGWKVAAVQEAGPPADVPPAGPWAR